METAAPEQPGGSGRSGQSAEDLRRGWARSAPWLLRQVSRRYGSVVAARLGESELAGLPRPGYWLLMALGSGARDATQLVEAVGVTKQAVSKVIDVLVDEELVVRKTNEEDRRRTDLELTSKGRRTVEVIRSAVRSTEHAFVDEVGAAAWDTTVATLASLAARAGKDPAVGHDPVDPAAEHGAGVEHGGGGGGGDGNDGDGNDGDGGREA